MKNNTDTAQIESQWVSLRKRTKARLQAEVKRHRRVVDLRECTKTDLVNMILTDRHGRRAVSAWAAKY